MSDDNPNNAKGNIGYHMTLMSGIIDLFHEAAQDGLLHQAEDLVDILWAMIPSPDKKKFRVLDEEHRNMVAAFDAWDSACALRPPAEIGEEYQGRNGRTVQMSEADYGRHRSNRLRITRKAQIWTDVVYQLGFLYKRIASGITVPDPNDNEWADSDLNDDECESGTGLSEGLAGAEDTQATEE